MYSVAVQRKFTAHHYLTGGNFGQENEPHSHRYQAEVRLSGTTLDEHGFLIDIDAVNTQVDQTLRYFRDEMLNDLPEFKGLNPSLEHFARIFCDRLRSTFPPSQTEAITVRLWEYENTWAEYSCRLS